MQYYQLLEVRKGHFVKLIDGKVVGKASKGEVWVYFFSKKNADVDPGILEVTLALAALFALIVAQPIDFNVRVIAAICFLASYFTAMLLYGTYVMHRTPHTRDIYLQFISRNKYFRIDFWGWLVFYYPLLLMRVLFRDDGKMSWDQKNTEVGYLTLLAAVFVGGATITLYLLASVFEEL